MEQSYPNSNTDRRIIHSNGYSNTTTNDNDHENDNNHHQPAAMRNDDYDLQEEEEENSPSSTRYYYSIFGISFTLHRPLWLYFIMAFLDVEANAITMLSFRFTTLTSITLFDALAIPSAMMVSKAFVPGRHYTYLHIVGVIVCMVGVLINVLQDYESDNTSTAEENALNTTTDANTNNDGVNKDYDDSFYYPHRVWGDILAITGGILYGVNDVLTEVTVRQNDDTVEYLGIMGFFAFLISLMQALLLEWDDILSFFGRGVGVGDDGSSSTCSLSKGWLLLFAFVMVTLCSYMGASRFLMASEAAFFNLSLLTGDLWSVVFSIFAERIIPPPMFFVALVFVLSGVVLYEMAPHPVVKDRVAEQQRTLTVMAEEQLAQIDNDFELQEEDYYNDDSNTHDHDDHDLL